jgi:hypothetical protein
MQIVHNALSPFSGNPGTPAPWLARSGLNEGDLALAAIHRRSANRLVELLFSLQSLPARIRHGLKSLLRSPIDWEFERYLAGAADCVELERRMQEWERRPKSPF